MPILTWDGVGEKKFETGVSNGVLYLYNSTTQKWEGVAWNGLTNVTESPEGGDTEDFYADNILYASLRGIEKLNGSIECFTYPDEFEECIGRIALAAGINVGQQDRRNFALSYQSKLGNDLDVNAGYKIHIIYSCTANASEMSHDTEEDTPNMEPLSFDFSSTSVSVTGHKSTSSLVIDSTKIDAAKLTILKNALYGTENTVAYLPYPDDILTLIA